MWGEGTVLDVDIGPNLYAYVRQNPWSKFDPTGLGSEPIDYGMGPGVEVIERGPPNPMIQLYIMAQELMRHPHGSPRHDMAFEFLTSRANGQGGYLIVADAVNYAEGVENSIIHEAALGGISTGPSASMIGGDPEKKGRVGTPIPQPKRKPTHRKDGRFAKKPGPKPKYRFTRGNQYPTSNHKPVKKQVWENATIQKGENKGKVQTVDGKIVDANDPRLTIEHKQSVVEHWNTKGRFQSRRERNDWYNDVDNLGLMLKKDNSASGGKEPDMIQRTGTGYSNDPL